MSRNMKVPLVIVLVISLAGTALVYAERGNGHRGPFGEQLTEEQREAVHAKVEEMREAGASREEIHTAVREILEGYGIEVSEGPPEGRPESGRGGRFDGRGAGRGIGDGLTEEQREAVHAKIEEMREAGASREEIHAAVREMLEGYGIDLPEAPPEGFPKGPREGRGPGGHLGDRLTEEQREAVHAKVHEMREAGASREEIHATVREMLAEFGINLPDCREAGAASSPVGNVTDSEREGTRWGGIKGRFE